MSPEQERSTAEGPPVSGVRRRLLRGGLSSAPLLLTLTSRPVLAQTCYSPSETLSGAISHKGEDVPICDGLSLSTWLALGEQSSSGQSITASSNWPVPTGTTFHSVFPRGTYANFVKVKPNGSTVDLTMLQVMQLGEAGDPGLMGARFVAAYLNILSGHVSPLAMTTPRLVELWAEWVTNGFYVPYSGATQWYAADIAAYLAETGIAPA